MERRQFLKKACLAGACFCGLNTLEALAANATPASGEHPGGEADTGKALRHNWTALLLASLEEHLDEETIRGVVKRSASAHFQELDMEAKLAPYKGNLPGFIRFLEENWGWKVEYDPSAGILLADENKSWCVCPIVDRADDPSTKALCYCSEGFAEQMFSAVMGQPVQARVVASVRRGQPTCRYRVVFRTPS